MYILDRSAASLAASSFLVFLIMALDGLDGPLARRTRRTRIGPFLDSLSDGLGFVLVPSLLLYSTYYTQGSSSFQDPKNALVVAAVGLYIATGSYRLANFALTEGKGRCFRGAPVSLIAILILSLIGLMAPWWLVLASLFLSIPLILSPIPYPKLKGWMLTGGGLALILGVLAFSLLLLDKPLLARHMLLSLLVLGTVYALSPIWWRCGRNENGKSGRNEDGKSRRRKRQQ